MAKTRKKVSKSQAKTSSAKSGGGIGGISFLTTERLIIGVVVVVTIVIVAVFVLNSAAPGSSGLDLDVTIPDASVAIPIQGREHIQEGTRGPTYSSNPPTSGPHWPSPARTGIYSDGLPDERVIHNMEHGHVWLSYRDINDQEVIDLFSEIQRLFPRDVIVTYRPANENRFAATSWGRLLEPDELDRNELLVFIERHKYRSPERIPG